MSTVAPKDIRDAINTCLGTSLGADWTVIKYIGDVTKNTQLSQNKVYGTRGLGGGQVTGTTKHLTVTQEFEITLVRSKLKTSIGDSELENLVLENQRDLLCCYKDLAASNIGVSYVLNVFDLVWAEPEFIEDGNVVVQRGSFSVTYRCVI